MRFRSNIRLLTLAFIFFSQNLFVLQRIHATEVLPVEKILDALKSTNPTKIASTLEMINSLHATDPRLLPAIVEAFNANYSHGFVQRQVISTLNNLGEDAKNVIPFLCDVALNHNNKFIIENAINIIYNVHGIPKNKISDFIGLLSSESIGIRYITFKALYALNEPLIKISRLAFEELSGILEIGPQNHFFYNANISGKNKYVAVLINIALSDEKEAFDKLKYLLSIKNDLILLNVLKAYSINKLKYNSLEEHVKPLLNNNSYVIRYAARKALSRNNKILETATISRNSLFINLPFEIVMEFKGYKSKVVDKKIVKETRMVHLKAGDRVPLLSRETRTVLTYKHSFKDDQPYYLLDKIQSVKPLNPFLIVESENNNFYFSMNAPKITNNIFESKNLTSYELWYLWASYEEDIQRQVVDYVVQHSRYDFFNKIVFPYVFELRKPDDFIKPGLQTITLSRIIDNNNDDLRYKELIKAYIILAGINEKKLNFSPKEVHLQLLVKFNSSSLYWLTHAYIEAIVYYFDPLRAHNQHIKKYGPNNAKIIESDPEKLLNVFSKDKDLFEEFIFNVVPNFMLDHSKTKDLIQYAIDNIDDYMDVFYEIFDENLNSNKMNDLKKDVIQTLSKFLQEGM